jgi:hypothetical protein
MINLPRFLVNPRFPPDPGYWEDLDSISGFYLLATMVVIGLWAGAYFLITKFW